MDFLLLVMVIVWVIISLTAEYYFKKEKKVEWVSDLLVFISWIWLFGLVIYVIKIIFTLPSWLLFIPVFIFIVFFPLIIAFHLRAKGKSDSATRLEYLGVLFFLCGIGYGIYIFFKYVLEHPEVIPVFALITSVVIFIVILLTIIYKYIFPSPEIEINLRNIPTSVGKLIKSKWEYIIPTFFIAPLFFILWFQLEFTIDVASLHWFYSTTCQVFGALLGIVVVFSIFILQMAYRNIEGLPHELIIKYFIRNVKGISLLYGSVISISFFGLILTPSIQRLNIYETLTLFDSAMIALLFMTILGIFISITLTIYVLFETVRIFLPSKMPRVGFDETRLYQRSDNNDFETRIHDSKWYGCSEFAAALIDFDVSQITDIPITDKTLQNYKVLIIFKSGGNYSEDEINAIEKFVKNGGGLFLTCNFWKGDTNHSTNAIAKRFGVSFANNGKIYHSTNYYNDQNKTAKISDIKPHEITKGVSIFCLHNGTYIYDTGSSNVLAYTDNDAWFDKAGEDNFGDEKKGDNDITGRFPVLSEMAYGKGRIVFISSCFQFANTWLKMDDNKRLGLNIVKWLAGTTVTTVDSSQRCEEL